MMSVKISSIISVSKYKTGDIRYPIINIKNRIIIVKKLNEVAGPTLYILLGVKTEETKI
jgi:hypothetical protein